MSANGPDTVSVSSLSETYRQNPNFAIHPTLTSLMISHTFLTLLIPLTISLFHFSTPQSRRRPVFLLNVAAMFLGFVVGVLCDVSSIHTILEPPQSLKLSIAIGFLGVWQSILVDLILLVRLISVYPPRLIGLIRFSLLIAIPVLLKLARVVNIILFTAASVKAANGPNPAIMALLVFGTKPYLKIEWATQMIDNTYVSLAFLWRIHDQGDERIMTKSNSVTLAQRMRTLSRIALTNFVVPTLFSIAQFVSVYRGASAEVLNQLVLVNVMLATFGVAFATIWAGNVCQQGAQMLDSKRNNTASPLIPMVESGSMRIPHHPPSAVMTASSGNAANSDRDAKSNE